MKRSIAMAILAFTFQAQADFGDDFGGYQPEPSNQSSAVVTGSEARILIDNLGQAVSGVVCDKVVGFIGGYACLANGSILVEGAQAQAVYDVLQSAKTLFTAFNGTSGSANLQANVSCGGEPVGCFVDFVPGAATPSGL